MSEIPAHEPATRLFLRHALATLAYRAAKTLRGTPASFGEFRASAESPRVVDVVAHMGDLIEALARRLEGESRWAVAVPQAWEPEVARFFAALRRADDVLASGAPIQGDPGQLFQGVLADAITHTGQLAMLRRLAGLKMKGEAYARADIRIGRVGIEQTPADPQFEF
ncbi:MAG: hypothetical protein ABL977_16125 [Candidatus Eisenbacteria bacterium]